MSYVFLPRSRSNGCPICSVMTFPRKSSKYPTDHPPYLKPPLSSSPGPPGACITPSSVMNDNTMSFRMSQPPYCSCPSRLWQVETSWVVRAREVGVRCFFSNCLCWLRVSGRLQVLPPYLAAVVEVLQELLELLQAHQVVGRDEVVDIRQHGAQPQGQRLEAGRPHQRVH